MIAIIGLGNPGIEYQNTYHNMGYMAVDYFAEQNGLSFTKNKFNSMVAEGFINGEKVLVLKPTTFMNLSGQAVSSVVNLLKIPLTNVMVVYDDLDIPVGTLRLRKSGSAGTHNGMRNIVERLGSKDFPRLRIGIGCERKGDLISFVLSKVTGENLEKTKLLLPKINDALMQFIACKEIERIKIQ